MKYRATPSFWLHYRRLPRDVQELADRCFQLLKSDSRHPSLHFKKIGAAWSVRAGLHFRALGVEDESDIVWFWIGTHAEYDQLLRRK